MDIRSTIKRWSSPATFALTALCFLLPFATVSCDDAKTSFTGIQLITFSVPQGGVLDEGPDCSADISVCVERHGSGLAIWAFAAALGGLALGLCGIVRGPGWCAAAGLGGMLVLGSQPFKFFADVTFHSGYELALLGFAALSVLHLVRALKRGRQKRAALALQTQAAS